MLSSRACFFCAHINISRAQPVDSSCAHLVRILVTHIMCSVFSRARYLTCFTSSHTHLSVLRVYGMGVIVISSWIAAGISCVSFTCAFFIRLCFLRLSLHQVNLLMCSVFSNAFCISFFISLKFHVSCDLCLLSRKDYIIVCVVCSPPAQEIIPWAFKLEGIRHFNIAVRNQL